MRILVGLLALAFSAAQINTSVSFGVTPIQDSKVLDLTRGEKIPEDSKHDWNLGATGLRGWMH